MSRIEKILEKTLLGYSDANLDIFSSSNVDEIINIQPKQNKAKAYQVKQIRNIILKYRLGANDD